MWCRVALLVNTDGKGGAVVSSAVLGGIIVKRLVIAFLCCLVGAGSQSTTAMAQSNQEEMAAAMRANKLRVAESQAKQRRAEEEAKAERAEKERRETEVRHIGAWEVTGTGDHGGRATLVSTSSPAISLTLNASFYSAGNRPQDEGKGTISLSVLIGNSDGYPHSYPNGFRAHLRNENGDQREAGVLFDMSFDGGKPITTLWNGGADGASLGQSMAQGAMSEFLQTLVDSKSLKVSYSTRSGERKSATFYLSGATDALALITAGIELPLNYGMSLDTIKIGRDLLALMPAWADPKKHKLAIAKLDRLKAAISGATPRSEGDRLALEDFASLYTFAIYMYDNRDYYLKQDPLMATWPQNLLALYPYERCQLEVTGEVDTGVAFSRRSQDNTDCDLAVIGEGKHKN